jgi:hypothetical protein
MSRSGTPILTGYAVEWDDDARTWVATQEENGTELRGRNKRELNAARGQLVTQFGREPLDITRYAASNGYTPPPRP